MTDIFVGILINGAVTIGLFVLGWWLGKRFGRDAVTGMIGAAAICLLVYAGFLIDNIAMARVLPLSNLVILGNLSMPVMGFIVGIGVRKLPGPWWRRSILLVPLAAITMYKAYVPLFAQTPDVSDRWRLGVCMQTSNYTCSAAASATLLANHRIPATEREMAKLCLTSDQGTSMWGIYRGLLLKTKGTDWSVRPITGTLESLRDKLKDGPILISVGLGRFEPVDARYAIQWGWIPGTMHTVVLYGFGNNGNALVGDPKVGLEQWSTKDLQILWHGQGVQLVRAHGPETVTASAGNSPVLGR